MNGNQMTIEEIIEHIENELGDAIIRLKNSGHTNKFFAGKVEAYEELLDWIQEKEENE